MLAHRRLVVESRTHAAWAVRYDVCARSFARLTWVPLTCLLRRCLADAPLGLSLGAAERAWPIR